MKIHSGQNIVRVIKWEYSPNAAMLGKVFRVVLSNMAGNTHTFQYLVPNNNKPHNLLFDLNYFNKTKHWCAVELKEVNGLLAIVCVEQIQNKSQDELNIEAGIVRGTPKEFLRAS